MLRIYKHQGDRLVQADMLGDRNSQHDVVWLDLINPTGAEDLLLEDYLGLSIPTRDEMEEIELSSRLYQESGAEFMTMTALTGLDTDEPAKTPITFILKDQTLITVRYAEPKPFLAFLARSQRPKAISCPSGEMVLLGLMEALVDRMADALERAGTEVDLLSRSIFRNKAPTATKQTRNLQLVIEQIGRKNDYLTMIQESLVSVGRLMAYHTAIDMRGRQTKDYMQRIKLIQRDAMSLKDNAAFLTTKIAFLLDATLGLISLEQNQIIKIFSVAAVVFLPPTLIASIYGMNFVDIPEFQWVFGYPWAVSMMVVSAILPYLYFKRRGWL